MTLILNTWIFENDVKNGTKQIDLLNRVKALGADGIEVRREYFTDIKKETADIGKRAKELNLIVNYSVPKEVFISGGKLNPELNDYFSEAITMGVKKIKFNIGDYLNFKGDLKDTFANFPFDKMSINIENDQTEISGKAVNIKRFLDDATQANIQIGYVYDLGNWAFTMQDAIESAKELFKYVDYVHLKNTISDNGKLITSDDLNKGMFDWKNVIDNLPKDVFYALEFPMDSDETIANQIKLLKTKIGE